MAAEDADAANLSALERFVVENDDLLELEERIGRFNIFDALRVERAEIRHSNFLAWLLTPSESHGQGDLFLKAVLMDMLKRARESGIVPPLSPVLLDGQELYDVEVRREWRNVDLLLISHDPPFVIAIENKVDSGEHSGQLDRYEKTVRDGFATVPAMFVFLAANGQVASDEDWIDYSYEDLHRVLSRVKRTAAGSMGGDVGVFLDHYLNLIGSRFMNDTKIEELCRRIYSNHRRAIDLIFEHGGMASNDALVPVRDWLSTQSDLIMRRSSRNFVQFIPTEWVGVYCGSDGSPSSDSPCDMYIEVECWFSSRFNVSARLVIGPEIRKGTRLSVIEHLMRTFPSMKMQRKKPSSTWTRLGSKTLTRWDEGDVAEPNELIQAVAGYVNELRPILRTLPESLKAILL